MKPYGNLQSKNLSLMLFLARALALLGILGLSLGIIAFFSMVFFGGFFAGAGSTLLPIGFGALFFSTFMAAIVGFEENYRKRTEHLVSKDEI